MKQCPVLSSTRYGRSFLVGLTGIAPSSHQAPPVPSHAQPILSSPHDYVSPKLQKPSIKLSDEFGPVSSRHSARAVLYSGIYAWRQLLRSRKTCCCRGREKFWSLKELKLGEFEAMSLVGWNQVRSSSLTSRKAPGWCASIPSLRRVAHAHCVMLQSRAAKRTAPTWMGFSASEFTCIDAPLGVTLQLSTPLVNSTS